MGRAIVVGHGSFNKESEMILVPPNTSITFLSDAGSYLGMPFVATGPEGSGWVEGKNCYFDYEKITNILDEFLESEDPVKEYGVVYNFSTEALSAESAAVAQKLQDAGKWGAEKFSKDPARLCTGTAATCPTPKLNVAASRHDELVAKGSPAVQALKDMLAAGSSELPPEIADFAPRLADVPQDMRNYVVDGVPDDRWEHKCAGLLKTMAGSDIVWVSCTGFLASADTMKKLGLEFGLPAEMTADTEAPNSEKDDRSGLTPLTDEEEDAMRDLRVQKYKDTKVGGEITIRASQEVVVLGSDYAGNIENTLKRQDDYVEGKAKKVGFVGKLKTVEVTGIPGPLQERVQLVFDSVMTSAGDDPSLIEFK